MVSHFTAEHVKEWSAPLQQNTSRSGQPLYSRTRLGVVRPFTAEHALRVVSQSLYSRTRLGVVSPFTAERVMRVVRPFTAERVMRVVMQSVPLQRNASRSGQSAPLQQNASSSGQSLYSRTRLGVVRPFTAERVMRVVMQSVPLQRNASKSGQSAPLQQNASSSGQIHYSRTRLGVVRPFTAEHVLEWSAPLQQNTSREWSVRPFTPERVMRVVMQSAPLQQNTPWSGQPLYSCSIQFQVWA